MPILSYIITRKIPGAEDVYILASEHAQDIIDALEIDRPKKLTMYLYTDQALMQRKGYGYITQFYDVPWYIGSAHGPQTLVMISPTVPNEFNDYHEIQQTILHEMAHCYHAQINPRLELWLDEANAMVMAGQMSDVRPEETTHIQPPSFKDSKTRDPQKFGDYDGYLFARLYATYMIDTYGFDAWIELIHTNNYEAIYDKTDRELYDEWVHSL